MRDPEELYELHQPADDVTPARTGGAVLVHAFDGFVDAGSGATLAVRHLLATSAASTSVVATFDVDQLLDYRSRRPRMSFLGDRFGSVDPTELVLHRLRDASGRAYYLLTGPEPDLQWERFVAAVRGLVDRLGISTTIGLTAVPWPTPHTRRLPVTAHASDPSLVAGNPPWVGAVEVPGHVGALLELRLGDAGLDSRGLTVHVPHYLATAEHPRAALTLLEHLAGATGLDLPLAELEVAAVEADRAVGEQVASSPENTEALHALERQYDGLVASMPQGAMGLPAGPAVPSADEIGEQVEQFLADLNGDDDPST